jgi:hypothetical protein
VAEAVEFNRLRGSQGSTRQESGRQELRQGSTGETGSQGSNRTEVKGDRRNKVREFRRNRKSGVPTGETGSQEQQEIGMIEQQEKQRSGSGETRVKVQQDLETSRNG